MKRAIITSLAVLAIWGSVGLNFAAAQFGTLGQPPVKPRPAVSPFINMGQGGAGAYYGLVRPQQDALRSITELQQGLNRVSVDTSGKSQSDQTSALGGLVTGHSATYFNYGHYYPLVLPGGASASITTTPGSGLGGAANSGVLLPVVGGGGVGGLGNRGGIFGNNNLIPIIRP